VPDAVSRIVSPNGGAACWLSDASLCLTGPQVLAKFASCPRENCADGWSESSGLRPLVSGLGGKTRAVTGVGIGQCACHLVQAGFVVQRRIRSGRGCDAVQQGSVGRSRVTVRVVAGLPASSAAWQIQLALVFTLSDLAAAAMKAAAVRHSPAVDRRRVRRPRAADPGHLHLRRGERSDASGPRPRLPYHRTLIRRESNDPYSSCLSPAKPDSCTGSTASSK